MRATEVRERILADHESLRRGLVGLEAEASRVLEGERTHLGELRLSGESFLRALLRHMDWEDRFLAPALREADAWGDARAARLAEEHEEQRSWLRRCLADLEDQERPAVVVARRLLDLAARLREDMQTEEAQTLDPRVLRDDVIGIDVESG